MDLIFKTKTNLVNLLPFAMPQNDVQLVRKNNGLSSDEVLEAEHRKSIKKDNARNYDRERTVLLGAIEKIGKIFQKQMAQEFVLDNESRFVEEFCTIIELCIQHGWKGNIYFLSAIQLCYRCCQWIDQIKRLLLGCFGELWKEAS